MLYVNYILIKLEKKQEFLQLSNKKPNLKMGKSLEKTLHKGI